MAVVMLLGLSGCNLGTSTTVQATDAPTADDITTVEERLVVAWVISGDLMVWQTGDTLARRIASGGAVQAFIAPNGQQIAFTRGPQGKSETLWIVDTIGTNERQLVGENPAEYTPGIHQIGDVIWQDDSTLYYNTLQEQAQFFEPRNDLYRVDVRLRQITPIAMAGDGGRITISPDGQILLTTYHGNYGSQDGVIKRHDLLGGTDAEVLMVFNGVSTASEFRFYPEIFWLDDNQSVLFAIPDPDLLYSIFENRNPEPTQLWRVSVSNPDARDLIGTVDANFFGQPIWSDDGTAMLYFGNGDTTNDLIGYLANGDGSNSQELYRGMIGSIAPPQWIPNSTQFVYPLPSVDNDNLRQYMINGVGESERPLSDEAMFGVLFVNENRYVYLAEGDGRQEIRTATLDGESQFIGSLNTVPLYTARWIDGE